MTEENKKQDLKIREIAKCFSKDITNSTTLNGILEKLNFTGREGITYSNNVVIPKLKDSKAGVYAFEITNKGNLLTQAEVSELKNLWGCRKNENVPRANKISNNQWLYVGRDFTDINNRIKAHLGQGNKSTYALKLGAINNKKNSYKNLKNEIKKYTITCYRFTISEEMEYIIKSGYIAMIEGILHEKLKPILGKK